MLLLDLSTDLLKIILRFAGDPQTLISCEKSCLALRSAVADDDVWSMGLQDLPHWIQVEDQEQPGTMKWMPVCPENWNEDARFASKRELACICAALESIRREQRNTDNVLVSVLGANGLKRMLEGVDFNSSADYPDGIISPARSHICRGNLLRHNTSRFRGDTLYVLTEIVQEYLIQVLFHAQNILCQTGSTGYPVLDRTLFRFARVFFPPTDRDNLCYDSNNSCVLTRIGQYPPVISQKDKDRIALRLAHRAGVPRMTNEVFEDVWNLLLSTVDQILWRAFQLAGHQDDLTRSQLQELVLQHASANSRMVTSGSLPVLAKRSLGPTQTESTVEPFNWRVCANCHKEPMFVVTPVPQQIEDAASLLGFPCTKVYGTGWVVDVPEDASEKETIAQAIVAAQDEYIYHDRSSDAASEIEVFFETSCQIEDEEMSFECLLEDSDDDFCSWVEEENDDDLDI